MPVAQMPATSTQQRKKPVKSFTLGAVRASIWENSDDEGSKRYNASFKRSYRSNGQWQNTGSMGIGDLFLMRQLVNEAIDWMLEADRAEEAEEAVSHSSGAEYGEGDY